MLVNSKKMLEEAKAGHYAVPAANIVNLENIKGVIEAAEETKHPLMVCLAEVHTPTLGIEEAAAIVKYYAQKSNQDIALHYDHGFTIDLVKKAIDAGFTSVMIDGSSLPFEENVAKTKEIVAYAHERNVTVEAEIGHVGEGDSYHVEGNTMLTTPEEAKKFVEYFTGLENIRKFADNQCSFSPLTGGAPASSKEIQPLIDMYQEEKTVIGADSDLKVPIWDLTAECAVKLLSGEELPEVLEWLDEQAEAGEAGR